MSRPTLAASVSKQFWGPSKTGRGFIRSKYEGESPTRPCHRLWLITFTLANAFIFTGVVGYAKAGTVVPPAAEIPDLQAGERLAHNLCVSCHVVDSRGPAGHIDRIPAFSWIASQPGKTATSITVWLSISHQTMPNYTLSDKQIRDVAAYIMSLRK